LGSTGSLWDGSALLIGTTPGAHSPVLIDAPSTGAACAGVASAVTAALSGELGANTPK